MAPLATPSNVVRLILPHSIILTACTRTAVDNYERMRTVVDPGLGVVCYALEDACRPR
jgi:hypothetical protein